MHRVITVSSVSLKTSLSPLIACWVSLQICVVTETIDSAFNLIYRLGCENEQVKRQKIKDSIHNSIITMPIFFMHANIVRLMEFDSCW